jgi:Tfp pilus assembly protein PilO
MKNFILNYFKNLSYREKKLLSFTLSLLLIVFFGMFFIFPQIQQFLVQKSTFDTKLAQLNEYKNKSIALAALRRDFNEASSEIDKIRSRFIVQNDMPKMFVDLSNLIKASGGTLVEFKPEGISETPNVQQNNKQPANSGEAFSKTVMQPANQPTAGNVAQPLSNTNPYLNAEKILNIKTIKFALKVDFHGYEAMKKFMQSLSTFPKILTLDNFQVVGYSEKDKTLRLDMTLDGFYDMSKPK